MIYSDPTDDEAKKHNENLPGMGGVFNVVNLHVYHYAGNNPVKYTDPDGRAHFGKKTMNMFGGKKIVFFSDNFLTDIMNIEMLHEHLFFDDEKGGNIGFGWNGTFSEKSDDGYELEKRLYDDTIMRKAVKNVTAKGLLYSLIGEKLGKQLNKILKKLGYKELDSAIIGTGNKFNCQDWISAVRAEYYKIFKSLPKEEQKKIKKELKLKEKEMFD